MRRGTRVGQAYVAVSADGSGINEEIVKSVDDAGPGVEKAGKDHGERYQENFSEGFFARMRNKFSKRLGDELNNGSLDKDSKAVGGRAGDTLGSALVAHLRQKLAGADNEVFRLLDRMNQSPGRNTSAADFDELSKSLRRATTEASKAKRELGAIEGLFNSKGTVSRNRNGLTSLDDWLSKTSARNNFLNIIARSLGAVIHGFEGAALLGKKFIDNMKGAEEGANIFQKIGAGFTGAGGEGGGLAKVFSGIASSGPGAAAAIAVVVLGASVLVNVLGGLLAIVTALASTIAVALTGALAIATSGVLALTAAGGLLVAAFMSMTDAQLGLLKKAFLPIKKEMVGIGQIILHDLVPAFDVWSSNIQHAVALLVPVADVMGKAFARAGDNLTKSFSGPGFQLFSQTLAVYLPSIITRLSNALGSFLNGALALFSAMLPQVNQFAGYLARITDRFAAWAVSAQGQSAISDFVTRSVASIQSLWNFIQAFTGFLVQVLFSPQASGAGNTIFDDLTNAFHRFTDNVKRAQANGSFKKWFDDGIKFGRALGTIIESLAGTFMALYNSGVLTGIAKALGAMAKVVSVLNTFLSPMVDAFGAMPGAFAAALGPLSQVVSTIIGMGKAIEWVNSLIPSSSMGGGHAATTNKGINDLLGQGVGLTGTELNAQGQPKAPNIDINGLIASGNTALNQTSVTHGGFVPKPKKPKWKNPYVAFANSLIKDGPTVSAQIRNAILSLNKSAANGIRSASQSTDVGGVQSSLDSLMESLTTGGTETVNTAQSALNSAAQNLANATSKGAAKKALAAVKKSQADLKAALDNQKRLDAAASILDSQKIVSEGRVQNLLKGILDTNATLADYAEARSRVAKMLDDANAQLTQAIAIRDDYARQVSSSIKTFASLLTAQAQVIDGVQQALTANDIVSNLQDKLTQIKHFQTDLQLLLAQGLSNDAYKQIVDAGVEQGTQFADALLQGGNAAIQNTNDLVNQINGIADSLGGETSSRLYQAGVDAAQGLVDGLTSLSAQLDSAAYALGTSIANAVKAALGIASPSKVLFDLMGYVGDGAVEGLDAQHTKVGSAARRFSDAIAITPRTTYSSSSGGGDVSGNGQKFRDLIVQTPTADPRAVALETVNEVVGRL